MLRALAVFSIFFCAVSSVLFAQTPDTATVQGQVEDANHAPVAEVVVTLTNTLSGLRRTAETDRAGGFSAPGLPVAGTYDVLAAKSGFADAHISALSLVGGATANFHVRSTCKAAGLVSR